MQSFLVFDSALPLKTELLSFINDFDHAPAEDKADRMKDVDTEANFTQSVCASIS